MSDSARRVWPEPADLDDEALRDAYEPDRTRPGLRANFVASLDGAIEVDGRSRSLSSDSDRAVFSVLRQQSDAVLVGAGTTRDESYGPLRLAAASRERRRDSGLAENPTLVIVSATLDLDATASVFTDAPVRPWVLTRDAAPPERRSVLATVAEVISCGAHAVDLATGLAQLRRRGLSQVLCEGGPHLFGSLLAADLVDELCLTLSPRLVGPGSGRMTAGDKRAEPQNMRLVHLITVGDELLTRYVRS